MYTLSPRFNRGLWVRPWLVRISGLSWNVLPLPFPWNKDGGVRSHHQNCPLFRPSSRFSFVGVPVCQRGTNRVHAVTLKLCFCYFKTLNMVLCSCNSLASRVVDHIFCSCFALRQLCSITGNISTLIQNKSTYICVFCNKILNLLSIFDAKTNTPAIQEIKYWLL